MTSSQRTSRRRGVVASRAKLYHALTDAGLKTQTALAERIADIEELDTAPKDVVNRVFRELPVDQQTLERVARALGVEAFKLYKTADEEALEAASAREPAPPAEAAPPRRRSRVASVTAVAAAVAVAAVLLVAGRWPGNGDPAAGNATAPQPADAEPAVLELGRATLVVLPLEGDDDGALGEALRSELERFFNVAAGTATVLTRSLSPDEAADRLRTDVTVDGEIVRVGRLGGVRVYLLARGVRRQVWAETVPAVAFERRIGSIARNAAVAIRDAAGLAVPGGTAPAYYPPAAAQDDYLEARYYMDLPSSELNIKRAQARYEAALRQDPDYARAHAGLCETLIEEHWMEDEERSLRDASRACGRAMQLQPDDPVVATAYAHFLRRTGRNDEAITVYEGVLAERPKNASAWNGLAVSRLHDFRQNGNPQMLSLAMEAARNAAEVDPDYWQPLFSLATMHWFADDVEGAIAASERARERDENEYVLANLGTFYLCAGKYEQAREAYQKARDINPQSYVGDEFLGNVHYFMGDFERSAELRRRAIETIATGTPEIHEMWGNLGDSYRQAGDAEAAVDAYLRAAEIAERDFLRGTAGTADRAARAYYYTMIQALDPARVPAPLGVDIGEELEAVSGAELPATSELRIAQAWLRRGEPQKARAALARATDTCPGYGNIPDLASLKAQTIY